MSDMPQAIDTITSTEVLKPWHVLDIVGVARMEGTVCVENNFLKIVHIRNVGPIYNP